MAEYDVADATTREWDRIIKTAVSPRPIAWVSTVDEDGAENLAPFSSYNYVGSREPVLLFSTSTREDGSLKDTPQNAIDTGEFAVNVVTAENLEVMDHTAEGLPAGESEFELADVERAPCTRIEAPRVAAAPVTMECELYDTMEVHDRTLVFGEVVHAHVDESAMIDGKIDSRALDTVGRLGGPYYTVSEPAEFERQF